MNTLETQEMNKDQADKFEAWFNETINTDIERNEIDDGIFYFVCCEVTGNECVACAEKEKEILGK